MAKRAIRRKQANKLRKAFRRQLPAFIDLRHWLQIRGYAGSAGQADAIILAGRVKSESHVLGIGKGMKPKSDATMKAMLGRQLTADDFEEVEVVEPMVSAKLRGTISVASA